MRNERPVRGGGQKARRAAELRRGTEEPGPIPAWRARAREIGWVLLPLRAFLAVVFLDGGISKVADRRFLDASSPLSMHASVRAARLGSPIGGLLGPVEQHSWAFGLFMAVAEIAVGLGLLAGLLTRVAAIGGMLIALSLWLTVSWRASPWFTSADVVYLFALTPLAVAGSAGVLSTDAWLDRLAERHPGREEDRLRRTLFVAVLALVGTALLGIAASARRGRGRSGAAAAPSGAPGPTSGSPGSSAGQSGAGGSVLARTGQVPVGSGTLVTDPASQRPTWLLQLRAGQFSALDAVCPHQGCTVEFVSASDGFACPCHGSRFDATGHVLVGPAAQDLAPVAIRVQGSTITTG
jgi:thiosulfate dehydrogenase [quinone] large subunit